MELVCEEKLCTGCGLCAATCPKRCIRMSENIEGFEYPEIDQGACIDCGACVAACPANARELKSHTPLRVLAGHSTDGELYDLATSGGAATALATAVIASGGCSFGVQDRPGHKPRWICCDDASQLTSLTTGVKYFLCPLGTDDYQAVSAEAARRTVLFIGLPCQVYAMRQYMAHREGVVLYVDLVCQGAPPFKIAELYRRDVEISHGKELTGHRFRTKVDAREPYTSALSFDDGTTKYVTRRESDFFRAFTTNLFLRESCYRCRYTGPERTSDITIGDFWGLKREAEKDGDTTRQYESLLLINTERGSALVDRLASFCTQEKSLDEAVAGNLPLRHSVERPKQRDRSFYVLERHGLKTALRLCDMKGNVKRALFKFGVKRR